METKTVKAKTVRPGDLLVQGDEWNLILEVHDEGPAILRFEVTRMLTGREPRRTFMYVGKESAQTIEA